MVSNWFSCIMLQSAVLILESRPIILLFFDGILFILVGVALLSILSLALLSILSLTLLLGNLLALLFWNQGSFEHLNSFSLLFILNMTLSSCCTLSLCTSFMCLPLDSIRCCSKCLPFLTASNSLPRVIVIYERKGIFSYAGRAKT